MFSLRIIVYILIFINMWLVLPRDIRIIRAKEDDYKKAVMKNIYKVLITILLAYLVTLEF